MFSSATTTPVFEVSGKWQGLDFQLLCSSSQMTLVLAELLAPACEHLTIDVHSSEGAPPESFRYNLETFRRVCQASAKAGQAVCDNGAAGTPAAQPAGGLPAPADNAAG